MRATVTPQQGQRGVILLYDQHSPALAGCQPPISDMGRAVDRHVPLPRLSPHRLVSNDVADSRFTPCRSAPPQAPLPHNHLRDASGASTSRQVSADDPVLSGVSQRTMPTRAVTGTFSVKDVVAGIDRATCSANASRLLAGRSSGDNAEYTPPSTCSKFSSS